jgi:hypothetical protein
LEIFVSFLSRLSQASLLMLHGCTPPACPRGAFGWEMTASMKIGNALNSWMIFANEQGKLRRKFVSKYQHQTA